MARSGFRKVCELSGAGRELFAENAPRVFLLLVADVYKGRLNDKGDAENMPPLYIRSQFNIDK